RRLCQLNPSPHRTEDPGRPASGRVQAATDEDRAKMKKKSGISDGNATLGEDIYYGGRGKRIRTAAVAFMHAVMSLFSRANQRAMPRQFGRFLSWPIERSSQDRRLQQVWCRPYAFL